MSAAIGDDLFGEEETGREVGIGAGRPHRHDERPTVQADFERRFRGGAVLGDRALAVTNAIHLDGTPGARGIAHAYSLQPTAYGLRPVIQVYGLRLTGLTSLRAQPRPETQAANRHAQPLPVQLPTDGNPASAIASSLSS